MENSRGNVSEAADRRRRINLYKKIIAFVLLFLILLPTFFCVILFFRVNSLQNEIKELKADNNNYSAQSETADPNYVYAAETTTAEKETEKETIKGPLSATTNKVNEQTSAVTEETTSAASLIDQALADGRKVVYLTFDDGPSDYTQELLGILKNHGVKATFFVNGKEGEEYVKDYNDIIEQGNTLAMHTYSHDYQLVYSSLDNFIGDFKKLQDYLYKVTGVKSSIFRFPGGSSNSQSQIPVTTYINYLNEQGITYFDWNVSSGDGASGLTKEQVEKNVLGGIAKNDISVVLMHDANEKHTTLEAVPYIIESLQAENALILPITDDTMPVQHNIK